MPLSSITAFLGYYTIPSSSSFGKSNNNKNDFKSASVLALVVVVLVPLVLKRAKNPCKTAPTLGFGR